MDSTSNMADVLYEITEGLIVKFIQSIYSFSELEIRTGFQII